MHPLVDAKEVCFNSSTDCFLAMDGYFVIGSTIVGPIPTVICACEYRGAPAALTCEADESCNAAFKA